MYFKKENKSRSEDLRIKKERYIKREFTVWETIIAVCTSEKITVSRKCKLTPTSLVLTAVKNLLALQETWARSLGGEGTLEKGMAAHSSVLAWRIRGHRRLKTCSPWVAEPGTNA